MAGQQVAWGNRPYVEEVFDFPFYLGCIVNRTRGPVRPRLFVMTETEIWPNLLRACHRDGVKTALVNGRISNRSYPRYRLARFFFRRVLAHVDRFCMQSEESARRIIEIGAARDRVVVTGSLKFDGKAPAGAKLVFHPLKIEGETLGAAPNARVKDDGSFSVSSYKPDDGAPAGEYAVTVEWFKVDDQGAPGPNVIPTLYSSPTTSPIKVTVSAGGPTTLDPIAISSKTAARPGVAPARR